MKGYKNGNRTKIPAEVAAGFETGFPQPRPNWLRGYRPRRPHGQLVREEIECDIPANFFKKTAAFIGNDLIVKDYYVYTHNGHTLEVSLVDPGTENEFLYGEVEFESVEEAMAYEWPFEGAVDVTKDDSFKMNRYWERTRLR